MAPSSVKTTAFSREHSEEKADEAHLEKLSKDQGYKLNTVIG
jgi:hypothetical protein